MAELRFFAELNDFLAPALRGRPVRRSFASHESLKHVIETLGVPHTEVALALRDGEPLALEAGPLGDGERVSLYPVWRRLQPAQAGTLPRFAADGHLGRLARLLRVAGFDTLLRETGPVDDWLDRAWEDGRIVLTRDRALLMRRDVVRGAFLASTQPLAQLADVASRFALVVADDARAARCMVCNAEPTAVTLDAVSDRVPERTRRCFDTYWRCPGCDRVYWHGSHWQRMRATLHEVQRCLAAPPVDALSAGAAGGTRG